MGRTLEPDDSPIVDYIDEKLDLVLESPQAWGGAEPVEPLVLMLLMLRQFAALGSDDERELMRAYRRHLSETVGRGSARLIDRLPEGDVCAQAVGALAPFVEQQRAREGKLPIPQLPPEDHPSLRLVEYDEVQTSPYPKATGS